MIVIANFLKGLDAWIKYFWDISILSYFSYLER